MDHEFTSDEGGSSSHPASGESAAQAVVLTPTDISDARATWSGGRFAYGQAKRGWFSFGRVGGLRLLGGVSLLAVGVACGATLFDRHEDVKQLETQVHVLAGRVAEAESRADARSHEGAVKTLGEKQATLRAEIASLKSRLEAANRQALARDAELSATLQKDPRMDQLAGRIDHLEHQLTSATPTGSLSKSAQDKTAQEKAPQEKAPQEKASLAMAPQDKVPQESKAVADAKGATQAAASAAAASSKASAKPTRTADAAAVHPAHPPRADLTMEGFVLRGFDHGFAVVEDPEGVEEVAPGDLIPGVGRVQRIERRAGEWVVVTDRGVIAQAEY
jgi:chemotaxis protein histidine kinase CheA